MSEVSLVELTERQNLIKEQINSEIAHVQKSIQNLTSEMANEVKEYTTIQVLSNEDIFQDIEKLQNVITDLGTSQTQIQQLFANFSGGLSSILLNDRPIHANDETTALHTLSPQSSKFRAFSTPPAFSMAQDFNREGNKNTYVTY